MNSGRQKIRCAVPCMCQGRKECLPSSPTSKISGLQIAGAGRAEGGWSKTRSLARGVSGSGARAGFAAAAQPDQPDALGRRCAPRRASHLGWWMVQTTARPVLTVFFTARMTTEAARASRPEVGSSLRGGVRATWVGGWVGGRVGWKTACRRLPLTPPRLLKPNRESPCPMQQTQSAVATRSNRPHLCGLQRQTALLPALPAHHPHHGRNSNP